PRRSGVLPAVDRTRAGTCQLSIRYAGDAAAIEGADPILVAQVQGGADPLDDSGLLVIGGAAGLQGFGVDLPDGPAGRGAGAAGAGGGIGEIAARGDQLALTVPADVVGDDAHRHRFAADR